jgi:hypothetical protein
MLSDIQKEKLSQQQARETKEQRGLPSEVLGRTLKPRSVLEQRDHEQQIRALLPHITGDRELKDNHVAQVLAKGQLTAAMTFLCAQLQDILILMDPLWGRIKQQGKETIVKMVSAKTNDIGDIKGAIGELNAILFAVTRGESVNTGGQDKRLPLPPGHKLGGIDTQDIDVRYLAGTRRIYMEAKYDAKTLIDKYRGTYTPKPKATGVGKALPYNEMFAQWLEANGYAAPKAATKKPAAETKGPDYPVVDEPLAIAPQQARYQAMLGKTTTKKRTESRGLSAAIANTHDWLLLFLPNSNGSLVSTRLLKAGWTIVIGDVPLDPSQTQLLLQRVAEFTEHLTRDEAEEWAETTSTSLEPADVLSSSTRWETISLYLKIKRDLPGYEGLVLDMPPGNYQNAAMEHYKSGDWWFSTIDPANLEEAGERLAIAYRQLRAAQDKVYEERIEKDRARRYGSTSYGN